MNPDKYTAVFFDLDGTLIDYSGAQDHAANLIIGEFSPDCPEEMRTGIREFLECEELQDVESCRPGQMGTDSQGMKDVFSRAGLDFHPPRFIDTYLTGLAEVGVPLPGIIPMLADLKERYTVGVVSNGTGWVQRTRLEKAGLMEYLDVLVLSCEVGIAKPDPGILELAMRLAGSEPDTTLFVGDSASSDIGAAKAAGVDFVYINPKGDFSAHGPRVLDIRSASELHPILTDKRG